MTIQVTILVAVIGAFCTVAAFFYGRTAAAKQAGVREGAIEEKLNFALTGIKEIKDELREANLYGIKTIVDMHEKKLSDHDLSIRRLHERIDAIERN